MIALNQCRVFLCDEFTMDVTYPLLRDRVRDDQHCVLFSSKVIKKLESVLPEFQQIHLDSCLRSTCQLSQAANDWLQKGPENIYHTPPLNNFVGEKLETERYDDDFEFRCFKLITSYADKLRDLDLLPVATFVDNRTFDILVRALRIASYPCHYNKIPPQNLQTNSQNTMTNTPIMFFNPRRFDGCEWSTVLVLLDFRCILSEKKLEEDLFIAITRASMKVAIIYRKCSSEKEFRSDIINTTLERFPSEYNQIWKRYKKPVTLFVGETPVHYGYSKVRLHKKLLPDVKELSLCKFELEMCKPHNSWYFVCHIDDVFRQSDLHKFSKFGIQSIFVSHASVGDSDELFQFYKATIDCITAGKKGIFDVYDNISGVQKNGERSRNLSEFLFEHSHSGIEPSRYKTSPNNNFVISWKKWMAKGVELQRLGKIERAKICYQYSIANLENEKNDRERLETTSLKAWFSVKKYKLKLTELRRRLAAIEDQSTLSEPEKPGTSQ